jgi:hypothetical protein
MTYVEESPVLKGFWLGGSVEYVKRSRQLLLVGFVIRSTADGARRMSRL